MGVKLLENQIYEWKRFVIPSIEDRKYQLTQEIDVKTIYDKDIYKASFGSPLETLVEIGTGKTKEEALDNLKLNFNQFIENNWWVLPHERTETQKNNASLINKLVDWEQYRKDNPVEEFVLGKIIEIKEKTAKVHWHVGHGENWQFDEYLPIKDLESLGAELKEGTLFGGTLKVYEDRVEWIESPYYIKEREFNWDDIPPAETTGESWPKKKEK